MFTIVPYHLCRDTRLCALQPGRWGLVDKWKALTEAMTGWAEKREKQELGKCEQPEGDGEIALHNDMIEFWQNLRSCMFVEGLVQGNVTEKVRYKTKWKCRHTDKQG